MENKPKIMIVDDAEMNRQLLMSILGEEYTYIEAEDGNQALHLLQKGSEHRSDAFRYQHAEDGWFSGSRTHESVSLDQ